MALFRTIRLVGTALYVWAFVQGIGIATTMWQGMLALVDGNAQLWRYVGGLFVKAIATWLIGMLIVKYADGQIDNVLRKEAEADLERRQRENPYGPPR